jgi:hypothetical protein
MNTTTVDSKKAKDDLRDTLQEAMKKIERKMPVLKTPLQSKRYWWLLLVLVIGVFLKRASIVRFLQLKWKRINQ